MNDERSGNPKTSWIWELNKKQLLAVCEANDIKIADEETFSDLRRKVREYVKNEVAKGQRARIKTITDIKGDSGRVKTERNMEISANLDYDYKKDDWEKFIDRIEQYFIANDITDTIKKRAILLSKVSADTYDMIDRICKPNKPEQKAYDDIVKLVKNYLRPAASYLVYRSNFRQRTQKEGETISEYIAALKNLANDCQFKELDD